MTQLSPISTIQAVFDEIEALKRQIDERDAQINMLLRVAFIGDEMCARFGLTKQEYRLLFFLVSQVPNAVPYRQLMHELYPGKAEFSQINKLAVSVARLRKALARHGVEIDTIWKFGYRIDEENLARLRAAGWGMRD